MKFLRCTFTFLSIACLVTSLILFSLSMFGIYIWDDYWTRPSLLGPAFVFDMWFAFFGFTAIFFWMKESV